MENKIDYLKSAISDAQELIRFIDTKVAVIITILGAYIVGFFSALINILSYWNQYSFWLCGLLIIFIILIVTCIAVTARILKPTNNPIENIDFGNSPIPTLKYYLPQNTYKNNFSHFFVNSKAYKLNYGLDLYNQNLTSSNENDVLQSLSLELFKVSFIRNIKNDRLNFLLWLLFLTTVIFFIGYICYSIETKNLIELSGYRCLLEN